MKTSDLWPLLLLGVVALGGGSRKAGEPAPPEPKKGLPKSFKRTPPSVVISEELPLVTEQEIDEAARLFESIKQADAREREREEALRETARRKAEEEAAQEAEEEKAREEDANEADDADDDPDGAENTPTAAPVPTEPLAVRLKKEQDAAKKQAAQQKPSKEEEYRREVARAAVAAAKEETTDKRALAAVYLGAYLAEGGRNKSEIKRQQGALGVSRTGRYDGATASALQRWGVPPPALDQEAPR